MPAPDLESYKVATSETSSATKFNNLVQAVEDEFSDIDPDQIAGYPSDASKFLRGDGSWAAAGGVGGFIDLRNPRVTSLAGNSFWTVAGLTDWDFGHWEFVKDVDGKVYGVGRCSGMTSGTIHLLIAANATSGVTRLSIGHKAIADGDSINPGSLTDITAQDITVPGTAYLAKEVTFTITESLTNKDILIVEVFHEGAHANDTLAVNTLLLGAWLEA